MYGPQIDAARLDAAAVGDPGRAGRQLDAVLRDVAARLGHDAAAELVALLGGRLRAHQHAVAAGLVDGLDHQLVEVLEHVRAIVVAQAHVGRHLLEDRLLAEVVLIMSGTNG